MKENNLNRVIGWSGLLLTSLLSTSALADNIGTSAEELGLSDYRHFVIYPRLDKALKAQKNNDEATAIREFEYIHQQVPDNIPLTLYLAEAYRHFGHDDRARLLLEDQLKRHPGDARLERSLAAIPVEVTSVTTGSWHCNHRGSSPILSHILLTRPRWLIVAKKHASSIISMKISRCLPRTHKRKVGSICYLNTAPTPFRHWRIIRCSLPITASMLLARRYRCC